MRELFVFLKAMVSKVSKFSFTHQKLQPKILKWCIFLFLPLALLPASLEETSLCPSSGWCL